LGARVDPQHDLSPAEIDAIEDRIYRHNRDAVGRDDARSLGFVIRDGGGVLVGVAAGYSWAGTSELRQMWVDEAHRGRGYGRQLVDAFVSEAAERGVRRIWVASYDFQAPEFYERLGFTRVAEFPGWPEGHRNVILCLTIKPSSK
jgi:ribosomal protein S18 acetylase RimI-like enzyme